MNSTMSLHVYNYFYYYIYSQNVLLLVETTPTMFETRIVNEKAESLEMFSTIKFSSSVGTTGNDCCTIMPGSGPLNSRV